MSLFGKDIESNICTLITFADDPKPAVLASLKISNLPFGETFTFNNSVLFAENQKGTGNPLSPMFWKMGCSSFERFFEYIWKMETKSLLLTKNVLDERKQLKTIISNGLLQVSEVLQKILEIRNVQEVIKTLKSIIKDYKYFHYPVDEIKQVKVDLKPGVYVTNCIPCNVTCHYPCEIPDNNRKRGCAAINQNTGKCEVCPKMCDWSLHTNNHYLLSHETVKVKRTYDDMKKRYEEATQKTSSVEQITEYMKNTVRAKLRNLELMIDNVNWCRTKLQKIALAEDPLTSEEYIDLMIEVETREHKLGYADRIKTLEELKKMSRIHEEYAKFSEEANQTVS